MFHYVIPLPGRHAPGCRCAQCTIDTNPNKNPQTQAIQGLPLKSVVLSVERLSTPDVVFSTLYKIHDSLGGRITSQPKIPHL
jgi:hypothetical protein